MRLVPQEVGGSGRPVAGDERLAYDRLALWGVIDAPANEAGKAKPQHVGDRQPAAKGPPETLVLADGYARDEVCLRERHVVGKRSR